MLLLKAEKEVNYAAATSLYGNWQTTKAIWKHWICGQLGCSLHCWVLILSFKKKKGTNAYANSQNRHRQRSYWNWSKQGNVGLKSCYQGLINCIFDTMQQLRYWRKVTEIRLMTKGSKGLYGRWYLAFLLEYKDTKGDKGTAIITVAKLHCFSIFMPKGDHIIIVQLQKPQTPAREISHTMRLAGYLHIRLGIPF